MCELAIANTLANEVFSVRAPITIAPVSSIRCFAGGSLVSEVNLARKLGAQTAAFWENADTNRSALAPIKKYSEGTLKLLATNLKSCSGGSLHYFVCRGADH